jgi:hypothetical protein
MIGIQRPESKTICTEIAAGDDRYTAATRAKQDIRILSPDREFPVLAGRRTIDA